MSVGRSGGQWHYLKQAWNSKADFWVEVLSIKSQSSFRQVFLSGGRGEYVQPKNNNNHHDNNNKKLRFEQEPAPRAVGRCTETNAFPFISQVRKSPFRRVQLYSNTLVLLNHHILHPPSKTGQIPGSVKARFEAAARKRQAARSTRNLGGGATKRRLKATGKTLRKLRRGRFCIFWYREHKTF